MTFGEIKVKLKTRTVGIAGCGGLGSNCAVALARVGIGTLILTDFDVVSESNLNRQYYFLSQVGEPKAPALKRVIHQINPSVSVIAYEIKLDPEHILRYFKDCDVIVEAFDEAGQKEMLIETVLSAFPEKPLVVGVGMAGWGMNDCIHYRHAGNLHICGDEVTEISENVPPLAPRVGMVANMQANVVLEILLKS
ncbi:MAG: sulfur carrier protein ThiS adenylyltransferase ThiF [Bacteroidetes bacterium]|nr:sulfur carrier protein ThiS adenylyltransferase ThiF [Bacteroidota bacterium]